MAHPNLEKMLATRQATSQRRQTQSLKVRTLRITSNKLTQKQKEAIKMAFIEAKWLHNSILSAGVFDWTPAAGVHSFSRDGELVERKLAHLHAHAKQNLHKQMVANIKSLASHKKAGRLVGALKYKSQITSIEYSSGDVRWDGKNKIFIPKIGWVRASGLRQLKNSELANARLVQQAGQYYLKITCFEAKVVKPQSWVSGTAVGLDMGVSAHVTLSDGTVWNSTVEEPPRLRGLQRKLARQIKGSNNHRKTKLKIQREYKRLDWKKDELANKLVSILLAENELVFFQDENLRAWKTRYGKTLQHSALGRVKSKLAVSERAVMLSRWTATTQWCPSCGSRNKLALSERTYACACGYTAQRDEHAAKNMVRLGLTDLPLEQRNTLVEGMSDKISFIEAGLLFPMKQATSSNRDSEVSLEPSAPVEASGSSAQM